MNQVSRGAIAERRRIEDELLALGAELEALEYQDSWNRERIRKLVGPAREAGVTIRDVARLTGLSTQTLHTWMREVMRPIPEVHFGRSGPLPQTLEQATLRVMGEDAHRDWAAQEVHAELPENWPSGSVEDVRLAMEQLARWRMIWDGASDGYRVAPPRELATDGRD